MKARKKKRIPFIKTITVWRERERERERVSVHPNLNVYIYIYMVYEFYEQLFLVGLFHIRRLSRLNSLACHLPETTSLAFKLHRKKFAVEKLYLPPDASETASRSKGSGGSASCGSGTHAGKAALEF